MAGHVGRFAPSPTGPLHAGSVVAALGSYLEARAAGGCWRLRIDDIDPPRQMDGASDRILRQLEALGLGWDGPVLYQSTRVDAYAEAFDRLRSLDLVYRCRCSRRQLARSAPEGPLGRIYPGTCRELRLGPEVDAAWRLRLPAGTIEFRDASRGDCAFDAAGELGDPVIRRRDGLWSYHLATTLDDVALGVTHVVRGGDLLPTTPIQVALQGLLGLPAVEWRHLPLLVDQRGEKLSKQTGAAAVDEREPLGPLLAAWRELGQPMPAEAPGAVDEFHAFAAAHWRSACIPSGSIRHDTGPRPPAVPG